MSAIIPFIKWAGGKTQLLPKIKEKLPKNYNRYIEPFVGGGAVLFELQPNKAIINDINKALIYTYKIIRVFPRELCNILDVLDKQIVDGGKEFYYEVRNQYNSIVNSEKYSIEFAAWFIFLNKHCFNGLYRVNSKGLFNVPYNNSIKSSFNRDNIFAISSFLDDAYIDIKQGDFEYACKKAQKGDFIFLDSPYAPLNDTSFDSYTQNGFSLEDHKRLAKVFQELTNKGCYCMLTNHNTELINELYKDFNKEVVNVKRMINSDATNRKGQEIIITNY